MIICFLHFLRFRPYADSLVQVLTEATKVAVNNIADGEAWNNMVSAAERVRESARDILVRFYHISRSSDTTASL